MWCLMSCLLDEDGRYGGEGDIASKMSNLFGCSLDRPRKCRFRECFLYMNFMASLGTGLGCLGHPGVAYLRLGLARATLQKLPPHLQPHQSCQPTIVHQIREFRVVCDTTLRDLTPRDVNPSHPITKNKISHREVEQCIAWTVERAVKSVLAVIGAERAC